MPRDATAADWYYTKGEQRIGPVSQQTLRQLAQSGELRPDDLVWKQGLEKWKQARKIVGLFPEKPPIQVPPPLPNNPGSASPQLDAAAPVAASVSKPPPIQQQTASMEQTQERAERISCERQHHESQCDSAKEYRSTTGDDFRPHANPSGTALGRARLRRTPFGIASCLLGGAACIQGIVGLGTAAIGSQYRGGHVEKVSAVVMLFSLGLMFPTGIVGLSLAAVDVVRDIKNGRVVIRDEKTGRIDWRKFNWDDLSLSWLGLLLASLSVCVCGVAAVAVAFVAAAGAPRRRIIIEQ